MAEAGAARADEERFALAEMSGGLRLLTFALLALPAVLLAAGVLGGPLPVLLPTAIGVLVVYAWTWLWMRPSGFVVGDRGLEIVWPWRRRRVEAAEIEGVERTSARRLRDECGFLMRVGVGGLWGGFGWLWSSRGRHVDFYVSRLDGWVLVRRRGRRPLLVTPERPDAFVARLRPA